MAAIRFSAPRYGRMNCFEADLFINKTLILIGLEIRELPGYDLLILPCHNVFFLDPLIRYRGEVPKS